MHQTLIRASRSSWLLPKTRRFDHFLILLLVTLLVLCPMGTYCTHTDHPLFCSGAMDFLVNRELFPTIVRTDIGTMINGDYGYDSAVDWTRTLTSVGTVIALLRAIRDWGKRPWRWVVVPVAVHWGSLFIFYGVLGHSGCSL